MREAVNRALALAVMLVSGRALALDPRFGSRGQLVLTSRAGAAVGYTTYEGVDVQSFGTSFSPSFDYFVAPHVSLGADASGFFQWSNLQSQETTYGGASLTLRGGVDVPLGRWVSLWPEVEVTLAWSDFHGGGGGQTEVDPGAALFVPLLFHLRSHLFVGVGPSIAHSFVSIRSNGTGVGTDRTSVTLGTILGGYTGGEKSAHDDGVPVRWRAFGEQHETVLEGGAFFDWLTDQRFGTSNVTASVNASIAYFFFEDLSLGLGVSAFYARNDSPNAVSGTRSSESVGAVVAPRFGYVLPVSERFSFYPNVAIELGVTSAATKDANGASLQTTTFQVGARIDAEVLYHFAPHFFVGLGPDVELGLFAEDVRGQSEPRPTTVGAALSMGGWL